MNQPMAQKYRPADDVLFQEVNGEIVILDLKSEEYFGLNAMGGRIWLLLEENKTVDEILACLAAEFDADQATIAADLELLLQDLLGRQLLVDARP